MKQAELEKFREKAQVLAHRAYWHESDGVAQEILEGVTGLLRDVLNAMENRES